MKTLRFKVGDLARLIHSDPIHASARGTIVTIIEVGPWEPGQKCRGKNCPIGGDYLIDIPGYPSGVNPEGFWLAREKSLIPIDPDHDAEDPGLTAIKKLLDQDSHARRHRAPATQPLKRSPSKT